MSEEFKLNDFDNEVEMLETINELVKANELLKRKYEKCSSEKRGYLDELKEVCNRVCLDCEKEWCMYGKR